MTSVKGSISWPLIDSSLVYGGAEWTISNRTEIFIAPTKAIVSVMWNEWSVYQRLNMSNLICGRVFIRVKSVQWVDEELIPHMYFICFNILLQLQRQQASFQMKEDLFRTAINLYYTKIDEIVCPQNISKPLPLESWNSHIVHVLPWQRSNSFQTQFYCPFFVINFI